MSNKPKIPEDIPVDNLAVKSVMDEYGLTGHESAYHLGITPGALSGLLRHEPGDLPKEISLSILTRLYANNSFLLEEYETMTFAQLVEFLRGYYPALENKEVAQILGATDQNGSRWVNGDDYKKPKIKRISRSLVKIAMKDGKTGLSKAIKSIRNEYTMQGVSHSIRSPEKLDLDHRKR